MTPDASNLSSETLTNPPSTGSALQVRLKAEGSVLQLILPPEADGVASGTAPSSMSGDRVGLTWQEIWQQLKQRLDAGQRFWQPNTDVHLIAQDRLLDSRQLQAIADALVTVQLKLQRIYTSRRQTAVVAATAGYSVEQQTVITPIVPNNKEPVAILSEPLYLQMTLRSGAEVRHPGTVVIFGDVNPGSAIIADGDILVWGRLRGVAHAGAKGNHQCLIAALQMEPTQLRIASFVARAPATGPSEYVPEVAYATTKGIGITRITEFSKNPFLTERS
jgi:septum site-determining protein MinC